MSDINKQQKITSSSQLLINDKLRHSSGFTIIEVALVLAVAGLIFLVVFIAWPALQNSQKDTAARQDVGHVVSALNQYMVDHEGDMPNEQDTTDLLSYIGKLASGYNVRTIPWNQAMGRDTLSVTSSDVADNEIDILAGEFCSATGHKKSDYPDNNYYPDAENNSAVALKLSNNAIYCVDVKGSITAEIPY